MTERRGQAIAWAPFGVLPSSGSSLLKDLPIVVAGLALFYGLISLARYWTGTVNTNTEIHLTPWALPRYALFSVARLTIAYLVSLVVTLVYAWVAAHNARAERILIPMLDTLQSIPVLSFLPGVMVSMVTLFPTRQLGVELGSILLIFTGQVWNMTFSVYSSMKSIPREMSEAAQIYRLSWWQRFTQLELPYSAIGLVWNSMMSVAGGWFFLMPCEMFVLGKRDLRLPGLGSYLQTAANAGNTGAILWGVFAMILVIVLMDQLIWRPVIAWSDKFKFEQVESAQAPRSPILTMLRHSEVVAKVSRVTLDPAREAITMFFARREAELRPAPGRGGARKWLGWAVALAAMGGLLYGAIGMVVMLAGVTGSDMRHIFIGAGATFLRVELTLVLAALWTIPVGVYVGLRPQVSAVVQPLAQIAASVPATALFPIVLLMLIRVGGGMGIAAIVLLLLGTQWYLLFNVIAGAMAIPTDLKEVCDIYQLGTVQRWRKLLLPAIFPYLLTGLVTASGGAWNASIVAEYFHFNKKTIATTGLGATISAATDAGNFPLLLAATVMMVAMVVTINRLLWRRLYGLAQTRYKLET
ncbi:MAG: ABC transporter permease subunit [Candidatus Sulfopaludibacter sp.]|nr:ABC transporter permease subunit [Candidatus Sulfopaludibacter sp.]